MIKKRNISAPFIYIQGNSNGRWEAPCHSPCLSAYHRQCFNVTYFLYSQVARSIKEIKQQITRLIISNGKSCARYTQTGNASWELDSPLSSRASNYTSMSLASHRAQEKQIIRTLITENSTSISLTSRTLTLHTEYKKRTKVKVNHGVDNL